MKKMKENKGFTLVELIVVIVILAILAAILVPALLGYIDRAKEQQIVLNAKSALTAAQAEFSAMYARDEDPTATGNPSAARKTTIMNTADVPKCTAFTVYVMKSDTDKHANYTIISAEYSEGDKKITFDGKSWDKSNAVDSSATPIKIKE